MENCSAYFVAERMRLMWCSYFFCSLVTAPAQVCGMYSSYVNVGLLT